LHLVCARFERNVLREELQLTQQVFEGLKQQVRSAAASRRPSLGLQRLTPAKSRAAAAFRRPSLGLQRLYAGQVSVCGGRVSPARSSPLPLRTGVLGGLQHQVHSGANVSLGLQRLCLQGGAQVLEEAHIYT
jgi:hypothetical protein